MKLRLWGPLAPLGLVLAGLVFAADQTHKWWMLSIYDIGARQPVTLTSFFDLVLAWNRGVSYGLLATPSQGLLIGVSLLLCGVLWIWLCRSPKPLAAAALGLVIGGRWQMPWTAISAGPLPISSCSTGKTGTGTSLTLLMLPLLPGSAFCSMNPSLSADPKVLEMPDSSSRPRQIKDRWE